LCLWAFEKLILFFLLGEKTIQLKLHRKAHWPWLGGFLLICVSGGFIGSVLETEPSGPAVVEDAAPEATQAVQAELRFARSIPGGHTGKPFAHREKPGEAETGKPAKFNIEKQQELVHSALIRRFDENSAYERADKLSMPDWDKIINPDGFFIDNVNEDGMVGSNGIPDYIDLYRGVDADFFQDNISDGVATDMSALLPGPRLQDEVLFNGAVRPEHDLGNAYVLATVGTDNHLRLYAGVERLLTDAATYIEFEFNQNPVRIGEGAPWPVLGNRVNGDLLVRMAFANQALQSVQLEQWGQGGFSLVKSGAGVANGNCQQMPELMYCSGPPPIRYPEKGVEVWDDDYMQIEPTPPDNFVEVGIDVDMLLGPRADITSVLFRTPEDIAMNNFQVFERLAQLEAPDLSKAGLSK
jgi:hypothetical protein